MEQSCPCGRVCKDMLFPPCQLPSSPGGLAAAEKLMQAPAMLCLRLSFVSAITYGSTSSQVSVLPGWYLTLLSLLLQVKSKHSSDSKEKSQKERTNITQMGGKGGQPGKSDTMVTRPTHCPWCCHGAAVTKNLGKTLRAQHFPSASMQEAQPTQS